MNYTKGEWKVKADNAMAYRYIMANETLICEVDNTGGTLANDESKANAKLISAAPDMYRVLKAILNDTNIIGPDWLTISKALAKAEGKL